MTQHVVILGGGLAGLSCGYEMAKAGLKVTVLEREPRVGGLATSFEKGDRSTAGEEGSDYFSYDYGPHRFHSKERELMRHVAEVLGENVHWTDRLSRIVLFGKFFDYPLKTGNILRSLSPFVLARCLFDYALVRIADFLKIKKFEDEHFSEWVTRRFGRSLANIFFVQYTEKAWKMPATEISATWAKQRITLLNLGDAIKRTLFPWLSKNSPRSLVTQFVYPEVGGIGELAKAYERKIHELGGEVLCDAPAIRVHRDGETVTKIEYQKDGEKRFLTGDAYISTIPVTAMAKSVVPPPPDEVRDAIRGLAYISIVFVYLEVDKPQVSPDNWVYLPEKHLRVHRISEFKNFSPRCAPPDKTLVCAEITCRGGDEIWKASEEELREIAVADLREVGLLEPGEVLDSFVKRVPFAYPVYDLHYHEHLAKVMHFVHGLEGIKSGGRQGLFRYNNMDQSIEMGRLMAESLAAGDEAAAHEDVATEQELFESRATEPE